MIMGDAADDARETEENWLMVKFAHMAARCEPDCPYCNPDFEPLFAFQKLDEEGLKID